VITVPDSVDPTGLTDVTAQLQDVIDSSIVVSMRPGARYRVDGTLVVGAGTYTIEGNGATIFTDDHDGPGAVRERAHVRFLNAETGVHDLNVRGPAPGATYDEDREAQHGFDVRGSKVALSGCTVTNVHGDFLYCGPDVRTTTTPSWVEATSCVFSAAGRQGVSFTCVTHALLKRCSIGSVGRTLLDVEPAANSWFVNDVTVDSCVLGRGPYYALSVGGVGKVTDVKLVDCQLHGHALNCVILADKHGIAERRGFTLARCESDTSWGSKTGSGCVRVNGVDDLVVAGCKQRLQKGRGNTFVRLTNVDDAVVIWNTVTDGADAFYSSDSTDVTVGGNVLVRSS
jgi:hypothetical protein